MSQTTWTGKVVEEDGELLLVFPEEMIESLGWTPGDTIVWDMQPGSKVVIARKAREDELSDQ